MRTNRTAQNPITQHITAHCTCNGYDVVNIWDKPDYIPQAEHIYHYSIEKGTENVYITVAACDPHTKTDTDITAITIKNYTGKIDNAIADYLVQVDNALNSFTV